MDWNFRKKLLIAYFSFFASALCFSQAFLFIPFQTYSITHFIRMITCPQLVIYMYPLSYFIRSSISSLLQSNTTVLKLLPLSSSMIKKFITSRSHFILLAVSLLLAYLSYSSTGFLIYSILLIMSMAIQELIGCKNGNISYNNNNNNYYYRSSNCNGKNSNAIFDIWSCKCISPIFTFIDLDLHRIQRILYPSSSSSTTTTITTTSSSSSSTSTFAMTCMLSATVQGIYFSLLTMLPLLLSAYERKVIVSNAAAMFSMASTGISFAAWALLFIAIDYRASIVLRSGISHRNNNSSNSKNSGNNTNKNISIVGNVLSYIFDHDRGASVYESPMIHSLFSLAVLISVLEGVCVLLSSQCRRGGLVAKVCAGVVMGWCVWTNVLQSPSSPESLKEQTKVVMLGM